MGNTEIAAYERVKSDKSEKKAKITKKDLLYRICGLLMSAATPYFGTAPFGLGFLTMEKSLSPLSFVSAIAVFSGVLFVNDKMLTAKTAMTVFIYMAVLFVLEKGEKLRSKTAGAVMCGSLLVTEFAIGYIRGYTPSGVLNYILESGGIILASHALRVTERKLSEKRVFSQNLTGEEKLSVLFLGGIFFLSLKNFEFIRGFSVSNTAAAFIILSVAKSSTTSLTAAAGIVLGMLCGIETDYFLPYMGAFGFSALLTGMAARKGKIWGITALALSDAIVIIYVNGAMRDMLTIYEIAVASVMFSFVSEKTYERVGRLFRLKNSESALLRKVKGNVISRLRAVSASFAVFGETLTKLSENENENEGDIASVFDKTAEKICRKCRKAEICWVKEFNGTYRKFFRVLENVDKSGVVREEDMSGEFSRICGNIPKLTAELNNQLGIYRINNSWHKRLGESREAAASQISGISAIINELAREINEDINYDGLTAAELRMRIESKGVKVREINVVRNKARRTKAELRIRASDWTSRGRGVIRSAAEGVISKKVDLTKVKDEGENVMIMIDEREQFEIEQGYAGIGASEESGDNFRCTMPGGGKFVIALSDGMGTGRRASFESKAIIELLDSFLRAGFDKHLAVRLINSVMVLKSAKEDFVTLDMCIIDLHTGEVEFIKTGAEPSFIKQDKLVETVRAASLPVGLMPEMEEATFARQVKDGDVIVMVSDGVESRKGGTKWIKSFMESADELSANELAAQLLNRAIEENDGKTYDDMTVISLKVRKKSA